MDNHELSLPAPAPVVPVTQAGPGAYPSHSTIAAAHPGENPFGERPRKAAPAGGIRKRIGSAIAALGALIAKFGVAIKALLVALPNLKLFVTAVAAYSLFFGWWFAAGFVVLLFVHEMGHVIALRREGIPSSAPMFIPFMGAVITAKSLGDNALAEARVGLAGPILGSLGAA